jgi:predicted amidophosphoribosyltransferase
MIANGSRAMVSAGNWVILVDDIVTTGASLTEAKRCLEGAGFPVLGFVAFAETLPRNFQKLHATPD